MKHRTQLVLIVVLIMATIALAAILGSVYIKKPDSDRVEFDGERIRFPADAIEDMIFMLKVKNIITALNITIASILIGIYFKIYRETKSEFSVSLIVVMVAMLAYAVTSNPLLHLIFGFRMIGAGPFSIIPDVFATLALSILLINSLK